MHARGSNIQHHSRPLLGLANTRCICTRVASCRDPDAMGSLSVDKQPSSNSHDDADRLLRLAREALQPFQVNHGHGNADDDGSDDGDAEFLAQTFCHGATSPALRNDVEWLVSESLMAGAERWHAVIDCARSLQQQHIHGDSPASLYATDVAEFVWYLHNCNLPLSLGHDVAWQETDALLALAATQQQEQMVMPSASPMTANPSRPRRASPKKKSRGHVTSHYWDPDNTRPTAPPTGNLLALRESVPRRPVLQHDVGVGEKAEPPQPTLTCSTEVEPAVSSENMNGEPAEQVENASPAKSFTGRATSKASALSPYFAPSPPSQKQQSKSPAKSRPRPGAVSCVPFPPLDAPSFGLVQEKMAHEPFWLLVAVTFLIRTKGTAALPVLYDIKNRFPTPAHIADPANATVILDAIRHLGLGVNRLRLLQKYARAFIDSPPKVGKVYRVRNYDRREPACLRHRLLTPEDDDDDGVEGEADTSKTPVEARGDDDAEAWEIGHMTQGKYALDSWRIFCRDELLGRATDWNGGGSEDRFQPEWMRVRPDDKELRACLRWMWMREGWEWDPQTGERVPLRPELAKAVNERRVEYDDNGGLAVVERTVE